MFKVNHKDTRTTVVVLVSLLLTLEHISQLAQVFLFYIWAGNCRLYMAHLLVFIFRLSSKVFFHNLWDLWGRSVVIYCQRYTTDIVVILGFLKLDFCWNITCLFNFYFYDISFTSSFHKFLFKFSGFILKCSYCTPYPFQSILVLTHYIYIKFLWSKNDTRHITTFPVSTLHKKWSFPLRISSVNVTNFFSFLRIWSHLMKKSLMENFIFCAVQVKSVEF